MCGSVSLCPKITQKKLQTDFYKIFWARGQFKLLDFSIDTDFFFGLCGIWNFLPLDSVMFFRFVRYLDTPQNRVGFVGKNHQKHPKPIQFQFIILLVQ